MTLRFSNRETLELQIRAHIKKADASILGGDLKYVVRFWFNFCNFHWSSPLILNGVLLSPVLLFHFSNLSIDGIGVKQNSSPGREVVGEAFGEDFVLGEAQLAGDEGPVEAGFEDGIGF
jgi:hypothetical protein